MALSGSSDRSPEVHEYSYDEGVAEVISRVEKLLEHKDAIVVAVGGWGAHVGKTQITTDLLRSQDGLYSPEHNVAWLYMKNFDYWDFEEIAHNMVITRMLRPNIAKYVLIVEQAQVCRIENDRLSTRINAEFYKGLEKIRGLLQIPIDKIDLLISICRPDKMFHDSGEPSTMNEVFIVNERAKDKVLR